MSFLTPDFLLKTRASRVLYHEYAAGEPIYDYHCHLSPVDVATNRRFGNLFDIWLAGDHYKWRAMRSNGVPEEFCTGSADPYAKYLAFARTVPSTLRNPLYHWSHLELQRYFGIDLLINEATAPQIWEQANARLAEPDFTAQGILKRFKVAVVCTTDDPADTLEHHLAYRQAQLSGASDCPTRLYPTYRPDRALRVDDPAAFNAFVAQLEAASGLDCGTLDRFRQALAARHDFFHSLGCRLSDHGLEVCFEGQAPEAELAAIYAAARQGQAASPAGYQAFGAALMQFFGELAAAKGWTMQLHLGAMRNNNGRLFRTLGRDIGCDSIGDYAQGRPLSRFLDALDRQGRLPRTVLYNLNPADNYLFATMIGNFQDGTIPGKIQFGSGWWFLDQKEGMEMQINALSQLGLLARFVGMLTDSRSFLSYCRHEYFRRTLCNLLGQDMEDGLLPHDFDLVGGMTRDICFANAKNYFGLEQAF